MNAADVTPADLAPYLGIPYERMNCQRLIGTLADNLFDSPELGALLNSMSAGGAFDRNDGVELRAALYARWLKLRWPTDPPLNGDIVLLRATGGYHIALFVADGARNYFFHAERGHGSALLPLERAYMYRIVEAYTWK